MRKILFLMAMLVCSLQFAMAGDVVTRDVNKLPVAAREMISLRLKLRISRLKRTCFRALPMM